jgi:outer membrane protein
MFFKKEVKYMHRIFSTTLLLLFLATVTQAQNTKRLTLKEAIDLALLNSKQLKLADAKVQEAQARVAQAKDKAWPEVKASATYLRINTPNVTMQNSGESNGGGQGSAGLGAIFSNLHDIGLAQLTVSEPIFAGFRIHNTKLMEHYLAEATKYDATTAKSEVTVNTSRALFQFYQLLETRKLIDQNLKQAEQRVAEFKNLESQSLLPRNDRLKAELQVNNIQLTRTEVENNLQLSQYNLGLLLGLPDGTTIDLDTAGMFVNNVLGTWETYLQSGLENRSELKASVMRIESGKSATKIAKAIRYPTLGLSAGYVNAYIPNVLTVTNALNGGLALQYNLTGAIHGRHLMQEAKARQLQAEIAAQASEDNVKLEIKQKMLNYQKAQEKIALSQRAIEQAGENFNITKNKYDAGLVIMSDYLDADVLLLQSRINFATAKAESMIAYYELQEATGNIH